LANGPSTSPSELAVLARARTAEMAGDFATAAKAWLGLASDHRDLALIRREAGRLLLEGTTADPARAYVELTAAWAIAPHDEFTRQLLLQSTSRTRMRFLPYAEDSAGAVRIRMSRSDSFDESIPSLLLPPSKSSNTANLLSRGREAVLGFTLSVATQVALRIAPQELRARQAQVNEPPIVLEWTRDGAAPERLPCAAGQSCESAPVKLTPGSHSLTVRLTGGLRPLARLWVKTDRPVGNAASSSHDSQYVPIEFMVDYLAARADQPVRMAVQGPTVLRMDVRVGLGEPASTLRVFENRNATSSPPGHPPLVNTSVTLERRSDGSATLADGGRLSALTTQNLALDDNRLYFLQIRPSKGMALVRLSVRDNDETLVPDPPVPLSYRSANERPPVHVPQLESPVLLRITDDPISLGYDGLGTLNAMLGWQRIRENAVGELVQTSDRSSLTLGYRSLIEPLHTTVSVQTALRSPLQGSLSQALSVSAFFMHKDFRSIRAQVQGSGYAQRVEERREYAGDLGMLLEPVATLMSGLHLVSKLGFHWSRRTLVEPNVNLLPMIDPDVYTRYAEKHWRAGYLELGLESEPFLNLVLYGSGRLTTNPDSLVRDFDHASASGMARAIFGHTYVELAYRHTQYFADGNRDASYARNTLLAKTFHSLWPSLRQRIDAGCAASWGLETRMAEFSIYLAWEISNGRRFRDYTPLEGEDYFFPQRGPGAEAGNVEGALP
jgi:hypothetical protein